MQLDTVLFAAGRASNTEELDLDAAGIQTDSLGRILVDEQFRTSVELAVRENRIGYEEAGRFSRFYEDGLQGYTYLEESHDS